MESSDDIIEDAVDRGMSKLYPGRQGRTRFAVGIDLRSEPEPNKEWVEVRPGRRRLVKRA